jgi:hypothetical protein
MIHFPNQILTEDMQNFAEITPEIILDLIREWEENPPDITYKFILSATPEGEDE